MADRTSRFILARDIRLDKSYKNVLDYTEQQMVILCTNKAVATGTNLSFIREMENTVDIEVAYGTALTANYIAFQNPDYSNKWFFAFIDDVEYISNASTRIHFTIDECSTWFMNWTVEPCFVIREHVNDDTVGANTVPENLEHGEYISNGFVRDNNMSSFGYIVQGTNHYDYDPTSPSTPGQTATIVGGVYCAGTMFYFPDTTAGSLGLINCITEYDESEQEILNVYVVPDVFVGNKSSIGSDGWWRGMDEPVHYDFTVTKQTTLNGYTPKNNKLLIREYNFLVLDNNNGTSNVLSYEDFSTNDCVFEVVGVPTCGGSIKCVPKDYKGESRYQQEGIIAGKFPTCGWANDNYTNWLTQQSVNTARGNIGAVAGIIVGAGLAATGVGGMAGGALIGTSIGTLAGNVFNQMKEQFQHTPVAATASGNVNAGDVVTCYDMNKFYFIKMSIKAEFARQIDDFFTRFGYKVNRLKVPNQTGRQYWNYVQIADGEDIGHSTNQTIPVPPKSMEVINQAYRNGVTIWHNHDNIGDYTLNNKIIS